ncbi:MAG: DUF669 domain-containing protein [Rikenellaceae bacterium]
MLHNFNAYEVEPSVGFEAIPAGKYQAVIIGSDMKPTKTGNGRYLELTFEVIEGEYQGRKQWSRLNLEHLNPDAIRMAKADLSAICRAVNVPQPKASEELHNLPLTITVRCKRNNDTDEITNEIKGYAVREGVQQPATTAAPIPPPNQPLWGRK